MSVATSPTEQLLYARLSSAPPLAYRHTARPMQNTTSALRQLHPGPGPTVCVAGMRRDPHSSTRCADPDSFALFAQTLLAQGFIARPLYVDCRSDQRQVGKCLRKVSQRFAVHRV